MHREVLLGVLAVAAVITAILTVTRRSPVYSTLFLIAHLIFIALTFGVFKAAYLTAMHILVYTGAIMVLFLFVVMLLNLKNEELCEEFPLQIRIVYMIPPVLIVGLVGVYIFRPSLKNLNLPNIYEIPFETTSRLLFDKYFMAFELVSALIIVAIVGSILIAKRKI